MHHPFPRAVGTALVALTLFPAAAGAQEAPRQDLRSPDTRDLAEGRPTPADIVTLVEVVPDRRAPVVRDTGFDARDAGIGAAGATGVILLSGAALVGLRRRHRNTVMVAS